MNATTSFSNSANIASFNKSRFLIDRILTKDEVITNRFFSYDKKYGIYRVLSKVLSSAPQIVKDYFDVDDNGDKVPDFASWLYSNNKFMDEKLLSIRAEHDASLFKHIKISAYNAVLDLERSLKNNSKKDPLNDKLMAEDNHAKFEQMQLLKTIFTSANLSEFQTYIFQENLKGFEPEEIVQSYWENKGVRYSVNAYYIHKSRAMKLLREAAKSYRRVR